MHPHMITLTLTLLPIQHGRGGVAGGVAGAEEVAGGVAGAGGAAGAGLHLISTRGGRTTK